MHQMRWKDNHQWISRWSQPYMKVVPRYLPGETAVNHA